MANLSQNYWIGLLAPEPAPTAPAGDLVPAGQMPAQDPATAELLRSLQQMQALLVESLEEVRALRAGRDRLRDERPEPVGVLEVAAEEPAASAAEPAAAFRILPDVEELADATAAGDEQGAVAVEPVPVAGSPAVGRGGSAAAEPPAEVRAELDQGRAHQQEGRLDQAVEAFTVAIAHAPDYAPAYYRRGNAYVARGEFDRAIADYDTALRLDPGLATAHVNRGLAYAKTGQADQVIADASAALRIDPQLAVAYFLRGTAYSWQGQSAWAVVDFTKALRLQPRYALAANGRGLAYVQQGAHAEAVADFERAVRLDPGNALFLTNLGQAYQLRGEPELAVAALNRAVRAAPSFPAAYYQRALAQAARGDVEGAVSDFGRVLQLDPYHADARAQRDAALRRRAEQRQEAGPPPTKPAALPAPAGEGPKPPAEGPRMAVPERPARAGRENMPPATPRPARPPHRNAGRDKDESRDKAASALSLAIAEASGDKVLHCPTCGNDFVGTVADGDGRYRCTRCRALVSPARPGQPRPVPKKSARRRDADAPRSRKWRWAAAVVLLGGLAVIGSSYGKSSRTVYPVRGKVLFNGKPTPSAFVFFHPQDVATVKACTPAGDETTPVKPFGQVGADGSFELSTFGTRDGLPAGRYAVTLEWRPLVKGFGGEPEPGPNLLPARYAQPKTSGLTAEVKPGDQELPPIEIKK